MMNKTGRPPAPLHEKAAKAVATLAERGIEIIGEFDGVENSHRLRCAVGHEWSTKLVPTLRKFKPRGCPHCAGVASLTEHDVTTRLSERGFSLVNEWVRGVAVKRRFRCSSGHEWDTTLHSVLGKKKTNCPKCSEYNKPQPEKIKTDLKSRGFSLVDGYKNVQTKTLIQCSNGHKWHATLNNVLGSAKTGCPKCLEMTKQRVILRLAGRGITLIGEYINTQEPTRFMCELGHEWVTAPNLVLNGNKSGCPTCSTSGFKPDKPAYFYAVKIESNMGEYIGFGITKNLKARMCRHRTSAARAGASIETVLIQFFLSGHTALKLERQVLRELPRVDTLIEGFRREAVHGNNLPALLEIIDGYKHETV